MSILVDTNILLRRTQPDHPSHTLAVESVARLLAAGDPVYFTLQNMSEFWNVATRPRGRTTASDSQLRSLWLRWRKSSDS